LHAVTLAFRVHLGNKFQPKKGYCSLPIWILLGDVNTKLSKISIIYSRLGKKFNLNLLNEYLIKIFIRIQSQYDLEIKIFDIESSARYIILKISPEILSKIIRQEKLFINYL